LRKIRESRATKQVAIRLKLDSVAREALELATQNVRLVPGSWVKQLAKIDYQEDEESENTTAWAIMLLGSQEEAMKNRKGMVSSFLMEADGQEKRAIQYMQEDSLKLTDKKTTDVETLKKLKDFITYLWALTKAEEIERIEIGTHKLGDEMEDKEISKYYLPTEEERMKDGTPMSREDMLEMITIGPELDEKQKHQMADLLWVKRGLLKPLPPGKARGIIHRIDVKAETVARSMYKWRTKEAKEEEKWLMENTDKWIQQGLIEEISIESATHLTE